jgi:hypothetical protein
MISSFSRTSLDSTSNFSSVLRELNELAEFDDFFAQRGGVVRSHKVFKLGDDFQLFIFGQIVEFVREAFVDLRLPISFRVGKNLLALALHALKAAADGVNT